MCSKKILETLKNIYGKSSSLPWKGAVNILLEFQYFFASRAILLKLAIYQKL